MHQALPLDSVRRDFLRRNKSEVQARDDAYDYQVALNQTQCPASIAAAVSTGAASSNHDMWWKSYGAADRVKHIDETWEEYEDRTQDKDANLVRYFEEERVAAEVAEGVRAKKTANSLSVIKKLTEGENNRKAKMLRPVGHTLLVDFSRREAAVMLTQRERIEREETHTRKVDMFPDERASRKAIEIAAGASLEAVLAFLEKQRAAKKAEEDRIKAEQKRKEDAARAEEERKRQEAEAAERQRRELEEEAKKAERKRREDERKAKAKLERETRLKQRSGVSPLPATATAAEAASGEATETAEPSSPETATTTL